MESTLLLTDDTVEASGARLSKARRCPRCHGVLEWIETGELDGALHDYYRWCARGCGLYYFDRRAGSFVRLA